MRIYLGGYLSTYAAGQHWLEVEVQAPARLREVLQRANVPPGEVNSIGAALWKSIHQRGKMTLMLREATRIALEQWGLTPQGRTAQPNSYGRIARTLGVDYLVFGHVSQTEFPSTPDLAQVASALGARGIRLEDPARIREKLRSGELKMY